LIKLIVFDLDGVLVDMCETHYQALNEAIKEVAGAEFVISPEEHRDSYNGLPTAVKLQMLTERKGLAENLHMYISGLKQDLTVEAIKQNIKPNNVARDLILGLRDECYFTALYTNSIKRTMYVMLNSADLRWSFDELISNEDVQRSKPNSEGYNYLMSKFGVSPRETMICEDSRMGRLACLRAGAWLCPIDNCEDLTEGKVRSYLDLYNSI
jgi:beta-phosphoglucomutase